MIRNYEIQAGDIAWMTHGAYCIALNLTQLLWDNWVRWRACVACILSGSFMQKRGTWISLSAFINFPFTSALSHRYSAIIALWHWIAPRCLCMFATAHVGVEATKEDTPYCSVDHISPWAFFLVRTLMLPPMKQFKMSVWQDVGMLY